MTFAVAYAQEKPTGKPNDTFEQTLIANERALQAAVAKTDKSAFVSLVLPEGTWTTKQGFVPMNLLADGLVGFDVTKWEIINPHVTPLTADSAVVTYVWSGTGTLHGQPLPATTSHRRPGHDVTASGARLIINRPSSSKSRRARGLALAVRGENSDEH